MVYRYFMLVTSNLEDKTCTFFPIASVTPLTYSDLQCHFSELNWHNFRLNSAWNVTRNRLWRYKRCRRRLTRVVNDGNMYMRYIKILAKDCKAVKRG